MRAEIITIGDEILIGQITNTNAVWIAQQLNLIGISVVHMASVSDSGEAISRALKDAEERSDFILITGGLGPTKDDITKKIFAQHFNSELVQDDKVFAHVKTFFDKRGREMNEANRLQAQVPKGCVVLHNQHGTAPGMWMKKGEKIFISMPGVPYEMKTMMSDVVLPKIRSEFKLPFIYHKTILTQGVGESFLAEKIENWENSLEKLNIKLAYLPQPGIVRLRLSSSGNSFSELRERIDKKTDELRTLISEYIFGEETYGEEPPSLVKIVSELLRERKKTISLAESCTGGFISSLFTGLAGSSDIFRGSVVPYSNDMKHELLGVEKDIFGKHGAVSKECVVQMAEKVREKFSSDYSISVSGIAGPSGGTPDKPVGTVWIAVSNSEKTLPLKFIFGDNRERNIQMTANAALNMLRKFILKEN